MGFQGSWFWLIFWTIIFWPIGLIYAIVSFGEDEDE